MKYRINIDFDDDGDDVLIETDPPMTETSLTRLLYMCAVTLQSDAEDPTKSLEMH